jgi:hypothetical protein
MDSSYPDDNKGDIEEIILSHWQHTMHSLKSPAPLSSPCYLRWHNHGQRRAKEHPRNAF